MSVNHILGSAGGRKPVKQRPVTSSYLGHPEFLVLMQTLGQKQRPLSIKFGNQGLFLWSLPHTAGMPSECENPRVPCRLLPPDWEPVQGLQVPRWELYPPCLTFLLCHPKMDTFPSVGQHAGAEPEGGALQQAWFSGSIHKFILSVESRQPVSASLSHSEPTSLS